MKRNNHLRQLYYQMLRIRMVEERIAQEYGKQEIRCPTHLSIGEEAVAVGVCSALARSDVVFSGHRSHAHYLAKGGNLNRMIAELYGKETGCSRGFGGSQHLLDTASGFWGSAPIVGSTIPVAVGTAFAAKLRNLHRISVVFFGDAATEEGILAESLNFAGLHRLPVLFVCENNLYSIYTHIRDRQPKRAIHEIARAYGIPYGLAADGNDAGLVADTAAKAVRSVRLGQPAFLEYQTYRFREHCGPNLDPPGARPKKEVTAWLAKDPVSLLSRAIKISEPERITMRRRITKEIDDAFAFAHESKFGNSPGEGNVYA